MTSALIRETKVSEYVDVDSMTKEKNYIYNSSDGQIVYVNAKGQLRVLITTRLQTLRQMLMQVHYLKCIIKVRL